MHVVAANLTSIHISAKIVRHVGGHLGFLGPHHDSSQSPSIFLHLRYVSNHFWNHFLWTSHAHRHPLRDCISSKICIVGNKIRFKAIHNLQYRENVHFLLPSLILRLYTGCRLDQTLSKCIASLKKIKLLKC